VTRSAGGYAPSPRLDKVTEVQPGIVYADLTRLTDAELEAALPRLSAAKGLVFDMRGYPGGFNAITFFSHLSDQQLTSAQWHIPQINRPDRQQMAFTRGGEWTITPRLPLLPSKRAFITDGRAISYAESCMGIIEHYRLGEIVGAPTAGTNGNVSQFQVPGGFSIVFTGMKVLKHDGSQHHGIGIRPTIPAAPTRAGIAAGRDEVLERAVRAVSGP
jgi:C-terminal processing protease CtpA/Prc